MNSDLTTLFYPSSIAVVGVSSDPRKLSSIFFTNLIDAGYMPFENALVSGESEDVTDKTIEMGADEIIRRLSLLEGSPPQP